MTEPPNVWSLYYFIQYIQLCAYVCVCIHVQGHSHQWWHICVACAALIWEHTLHDALRSFPARGCPLPIIDMVLTAEVLTTPGVIPVDIDADYIYTYN